MKTFTLSIRPAPTSMPLNRTVIFAAIASNRQGQLVRANGTKWEAYNVTEHRKVLISRDGTFTPELPGDYKIVAAVGNVRTQLTFHVEKGVGVNRQEKPLQTTTVSSISEVAAPQLIPKHVIAPAWQRSYLSAALRAPNRIGHNPIIRPFAFRRHSFQTAIRRIQMGARGHRVLMADANDGNENYVLTIPILNMPGRGQDLSQSLVYNSKAAITTSSMVSTANGGSFSWDCLNDFPAMGWSIGFGRAVNTANGGVVLQDADGTVHRFNGNIDWYTWGYIFRGWTTDGTLVNYRFTFDSNGMMIAGEAYYPNGTVVLYGAGPDKASFEDGYNIMYPVKITDRNGNYITVIYTNNQGPLESVVDTLGRVVQYYYGQFGQLSAIVAPGLNGVSRTVARFLWGTQPNNSCPGGQAFNLTGIYFPGTNTGYWFGDPDSYTSYGMLVKVSKRRGMTFSAAGLTDQGTLTPGDMSNEQVFNYPATWDSSSSQPPTYTTKTESWAVRDLSTGLYATSSGVTTYSAQLDANPRQADTTYPDGTRVTHLMFNRNDPTAYDDGLVFQETTYDPSGNQVLRVVTNWEKGEYDSPRVQSVQVTDKLGQTTTKRYIYYAPPPNTIGTNQLIEIQELDFDGNTILRKTQFEYQSDQRYIDRHILNLISAVTKLELDGSRASRTEYAYDGQALTDTPGIIGHSDAYNPYAPVQTTPGTCQQQCTFDDTTFQWTCKNVCTPDKKTSEYDPTTDYRGNVTKTTRYADARNLAGPVTEERRYTIAGNVVKISGSCCVETDLTYGTENDFASPTFIFKGDPNNSTAQLTQSFSYDTSSGLQLSSTDPNGRTTSTQYDPVTLRPTRVTLSTSAFTTFDYLDADMTTVESSVLPGKVLAGRKLTFVNGLGLTERVDTQVDDSTWSKTSFQYDAMGRLWRQSQPYQDAPSVWTEVSYDSLRQITAVHPPDGNQISTTYDELVRPSGASKEPGHTVHVFLPMGNQWFRMDALGRLAEVVESPPYFGGSGARTQYLYNALDRLVLVTQGTSAQQRQFQYDSLGRLTAQYLPEKRRSLDGNGNYVEEAGHWSDAFTYDERSNLTSHTDARGVKSTYNYNDPLARLLSKSYINENPSDKNITPSYPIQYSYVQTGDVTRLFQVAMLQPGNTTWGLQEYSYDSQGRLASKVLSYGAERFVLDYSSYDAFDRVTQETYPAEFGTPSNVRRVVNYGYAVGGSLKQCQLDGSAVVSQVTHNVAGQVTQMVIGPAGPQQTTETYGYDSRTAWMTSESVQRGATNLLTLTYLYYPGGQLMQEVNSAGTIIYGYDTLGRLHSLRGTNNSDGTSWSEGYEFDEYGNLTGAGGSGYIGNFRVPADGLPSASYDPKTNHVTVPNFSYDAAGNVTLEQRADGSWQEYRYDQENHLSEVIDQATGMPLESYVYGADGRRLLRAADFRRTSLGSTTPTSRTYYSWDGDHVIGQYVQGPRGSLTWSKSQIFLGDRLIAALLPSAAGDMIDYYHSDLHGTRLITNNINSTATEQWTLPFGTAVPGQSFSDPVFTSYDRSTATGLDYAVNRYYRPGLRFTQADPVGMLATDTTNPQSLNAYVYVGNDPVNNRDKLGTFSYLSMLSGVFDYMAVPAYMLGMPEIGAGANIAKGSIKLAQEFAGPDPYPATSASEFWGQFWKGLTSSSPLGTADTGPANEIVGTTEWHQEFTQDLPSGLQATGATVQITANYSNGPSQTTTITAENYPDGSSRVTFYNPDRSTRSVFNPGDGSDPITTATGPGSTAAPGTQGEEVTPYWGLDLTGVAGSSLVNGAATGTTGTQVTPEWGLDLTGCCDGPE